jgi:hypoxanthine phosphoribosyltransferase
LDTKDRAAAAVRKMSHRLRGADSGKPATIVSGVSYLECDSYCRRTFGHELAMKRLLEEDQIHQGVQRLAGELTRDYSGRPLTVVGVLTGSFILLADLIRRIDLPMRVGVIQTRSYRGAATSPGALEINDAMLPDIEGRDVLLVDDIFDTGHTLSGLIEKVRSLGPKSVRSAVLLRKLGRQEVAAFPDYVVFEVPDAFVVGYGLDYQDAYRHLPYLAVMEGDDLAHADHA